MNGLAGYYVSTIGKPHEYFDLTGSGTCNALVSVGFSVSAFARFLRRARRQRATVVR